MQGDGNPVLATSLPTPALHPRLVVCPPLSLLAVLLRYRQVGDAELTRCWLNLCLISGGIGVGAGRRLLAALVQTHSWASAARPSLLCGDFLAGICRLQKLLPVGVTAVLLSPPSAPPSSIPTAETAQPRRPRCAPVFTLSRFQGLSGGRAGEAPRSRLVSRGAHRVWVWCAPTGLSIAPKLILLTGCVLCKCQHLL